MWGFSPAANLLAEAEHQAVDGEPIEILIVNSCDIRHVFKTAAQRRRSAPNSPLHFYLIDTPTEVVARHFLLLQVLTDWEVSAATSNEGHIISSVLLGGCCI